MEITSVQKDAYTLLKLFEKHETIANRSRCFCMGRQQQKNKVRFKKFQNLAYFSQNGNIV